MNNLLQNLEKLGLDHDEIKVYLHLLAKIEDTPLGISKITKIPRTTVSRILARLKSKHLVSSFTRNKKEFWESENIKSLEKDIEEKRTALLQLPELLRDYVVKNKKSSTVKLYTGKEGMKFVWEDILHDTQNKKFTHIYAFSDESLFDVLPRYFPQWVEKTQATRVKTYAKLILSEGHKKILPKAGEIEIRYIKQKYLFTGDISIYGNKVAIFIFDKKKPEAMIIDSPVFTEMLLGIFNFVWDVLGENN